MKVRFNNSKEIEPANDGGLKVMYAPGKRAAYRLRWYLILLIVSSPLLWLAFRLVSAVAIIEAPALLYRPLSEVRAMESGVVGRLHVQQGEQVAPGDLLVSLENPALAAQQILLEDGTNGVPAQLAGSAFERQRQALQLLVDSARARVKDIAHLVAAGAATRGELQQAQDLLNDRLATLAGFERGMELGREEALAMQRNRGELRILAKRLELLQVKAAVAGTVSEIMVHEGESAGPGTLLLALHTEQQWQLQVYLDPRQRNLARTGQPLKLRLPDGSWFDALVASEPQLVSRLPQSMRRELGSGELGLVVMVEPLTPIPAHWLLENLQLTARFPGGLLARLGW